MRKTSYLCISIVAYIIIIFIAIGCESISNQSTLNEVSMKCFYEKEDFISIIIGESTYQDVYIIAPSESMQVTSYGGFCDYPMQSGGYLRIKFYGKELVVGIIEEMNPS